MSEPGRPRFTLTIEALPDPVPPTVRLRKLLKHALRQLNLKCTSAEVPDQKQGKEASVVEDKRP